MKKRNNWYHTLFFLSVHCAQDLLIQKSNYFRLNRLQIWLTSRNSPNFSFKDQHPYFSYILHLQHEVFFASHPVTENEFGLIALMLMLLLIGQQFESDKTIVWM